MDCESARATLLRRCAEHYAKLLASNATEPKRVRLGMLEAEKIIRTEPAVSDVQDWLYRINEKLDLRADEFSADQYDEDGWSIGGLRAIQTDVRAILEQSTKQKSGIAGLGARLKNWLRRRNNDKCIKRVSVD
jgi:hypothetical protein